MNLICLCRPVQFTIIMCGLFTLAFAGCGSDHTDKRAADFGKFLTEKHLPDGTYKDATESMKTNKAVVEYGVFANQWRAGGPNYSVTITKYSTAKDCTNTTLTYKNDPNAIIDDVFAIIPSNSEVDKAAIQKIKTAWSEFKKN